ncbi:hypothetical protein MTO96_025309 [Rhipicephalus appendiculatus]
MCQLDYAENPLASVMSSNVEPALSANKVTFTFTPKRPPVPIRRKALFLGNTCIHYTGIPIQLAAVSADAVEKSHQYFPEAEHLELTAECESAIRKAASYTKVTHLSLFSAMPKNKSPFEPHLKFLGMRACGIHDEEDIAANFSNLEHLRLGSAMKEASFFKLLKSCPGLRELEIDKDELTTAFVVALDDVDDLPSDLDLTLSCLPSLRRVRTDNYDIRFHINSCFPNIALDWCTCTVCASEFPEMNELHGDMYRCLLQLKLPGQIESVYIDAQDKMRVKLKAEVSVDIEEEELKLVEVAVDTKDTKMKAVEAAIDIKDEKLKAEAAVGRKGEGG